MRSDFKNPSSSTIENYVYLHKELFCSCETHSSNWTSLAVPKPGVICSPDRSRRSLQYLKFYPELLWSDRFEKKECGLPERDLKFK